MIRMHDAGPMAAGWHLATGGGTTGAGVGAGFAAFIAARRCMMTARWASALGVSFSGAGSARAVGIGGCTLVAAMSLLSERLTGATMPGLTKASLAPCRQTYSSHNSRRYLSGIQSFEWREANDWKAMTDIQLIKRLSSAEILLHA